MTTRLMAWTVLAIALSLGNLAQAATFPSDVPADGVIDTGYDPVTSTKSYAVNVIISDGGLVQVGENGDVTGAPGSSLTVAGGNLEIHSNKFGAASWTTDGADFNMTGGAVSINGAAYSAILNIDGAASVSGGKMTVKNGDFWATTQAISRSGVIELDGGVLVSTGTASDGTGVRIDNGGTLRGAGFVNGATNSVFSLSGGTLGMSGMILLTGFHGMGHTSLDGALAFDGVATGDAFSGMDSGVFDAGYSDIVMGDRTTITIEGGLAQAIAAKAAANAFDNTDANSVLLVTGAGSNDYSAYLKGGAREVVSALGRYAIATGDTIGGSADDLKLVNATSVVDFTTADSQNGRANFESNMNLFSPLTEGSGFRDQVFGAAIGQSGLDPSTQLHGDYKHAPIYSNGSGVGNYNEQILIDALGSVVTIS